MARKQKNAYWLLPITALLLAGAVMSVGESQARYVNTAAWYTVAEPVSNIVSSDCLEQVSRPPVTVLLGQIASESREISFTLSSDTNTTGALTWSVDRPEYLDVQLQVDGSLLSDGDSVSLFADTPVTVTMTLAPTQMASEPRDAVDAHVQVGFADALTGTFQVELTEVLLPEVTETEVTELEATEPEATEPEVTEPEVTEPEVTEPEPTDPPAAIALQSAQIFHPQCVIPLHLTAIADMQISLQPVWEETLQNFPRGTRFSLDEGVSWFMLYEEDLIPLHLAAETPLTVLLDLSHTDLAAESVLTFTVGNDVTAALTANTDPLYQMSQQVLTPDTQLTILLAEPWQNCTLTYSVDMLMATEEGKAYVPVSLSEGGLMAELSEQQLSIYIGETLPQPGTYRLKASWMDGDICIFKKQMNFFIHYGAEKTIQEEGGDQP